MIKSPYQTNQERFQTMKAMAAELALFQKITEKMEELETMIKERVSNEQLVSLINPLIPEVKHGHTPTEEELLTIIQPLIPQVKDGHTPTGEELIAMIRPLIPEAKNGETPTDEKLLSLIRPLIPKIDAKKIQITDEHIEKISEKVSKKIKIPINEIDPLSIIDKIMSMPETKHLSKDHMKGLEQTISAMQTQLKHGYLHGGGISSLQAGAGITLVKNADGSYTITSTASGGSTFQLPLTGAVDGSNQTYTWLTEPKAICVDGTIIQKVSQNGDDNWIGTLSTLLTRAPTESCFAVA